MVSESAGISQDIPVIPTNRPDFGQFSIVDRYRANCNPYRFRYRYRKPRHPRTSIPKIAARIALPFRAEEVVARKRVQESIEILDEHPAHGLGEVQDGKEELG